MNVTVAESAPWNAPAPFVFCTVNPRYRVIAVPLVVVAIESVVPLDGIVVYVPPEVADSFNDSKAECVKPAVVNVTAAELYVVKPEYVAVSVYEVMYCALVPFTVLSAPQVGVPTPSPFTLPNDI